MRVKHLKYVHRYGINLKRDPIVMLHLELNNNNCLCREAEEIHFFYPFLWKRPPLSGWRANASGERKISVSAIRGQGDSAVQWLAPLPPKVRGFESTSILELTDFLSISAGGFLRVPRFSPAVSRKEPINCQKVETCLSGDVFSLFSRGSPNPSENFNFSGSYIPVRLESGGAWFEWLAQPIV